MGLLLASHTAAVQLTLENFAFHHRLGVLGGRLGSWEGIVVVMAPISRT